MRKCHANTNKGQPCQNNGCFTRVVNNRRYQVCGIAKHRTGDVTFWHKGTNAEPKLIEHLEPEASIPKGPSSAAQLISIPGVMTAREAREKAKERYQTEARTSIPQDVLDEMESTDIDINKEKNTMSTRPENEMYRQQFELDEDTPMTLTVLGHRPNKLPGGWDGQPMELTKDVSRIVQEIAPDIIVSGCALGPDQWGLIIGNKYDIDTVAFMPFRDFDISAKWPAKNQEFLRKLLLNTNHLALDSLLHMHPDLEDRVHKVFHGHTTTKGTKTIHKTIGVVHVSDPGYHPTKMFKRNEVMIDVSNIVVAVINHREYEAVQRGINVSGGTAHAVRYALSQNKEVIPVFADDYNVG